MQYGLIVMGDRDDLKQILDNMDNLGQSVTATELPDTAVVAATINTPECNNDGFDSVVDTELDADGVPWDERIHAGTKTKTAKGVWKKKKGVQPAEYDAVTAELKEANEDDGHIPGFAKQPEPVAVSQPVAPTAPPMPAAPQPVAMPTPAPIAPPQPVAQTKDFAGLLVTLERLFSEKKIEPTYIETHLVGRINSTYGVQIVAPTDVMNDTDKVDFMWRCLEADGVL